MAENEQQQWVPTQDDEYHGQGGSYVYDPETGVRTRVDEPTKPAEAQQ